MYSGRPRPVLGLPRYGRGDEERAKEYEGEGFGTRAWGQHA